LWDCAGVVSVSGVECGTMCTLFGNDDAVFLYGGEWKGFDHSCVGEVSFSSSMRGVDRLLSATELLNLFGGRGGGSFGFFPFLQLLLSRWSTGLEEGSLLKWMAYCIFSCLIRRCRGGREASISRASVDVVRKAAHIRINARLCTFAKGLS